MPQQKQYLDDNGNPVTPAKQYLDDEGNPVLSTPAPIGVTGTIRANAPSLRDRLTEVQKFAPGEPIGVKDLENMGAGLLSIPLHPVDALAGLGGVVTAPFEMLAGRPFSSTTPGQMVQQAKENPRGFVESGIGQIAFGEGAGELAPRLVPKGGASRTVTDLVKDTQAENTKAAEARKGEVAKHFEKTRTEPTTTLESGRERTKGELQSHKEALNKGIEKLDTQVRGGLEAAEDKVNAEANRRYNELAEQLNPQEASPELLPSILESAAEKIKGSNTETPILRDLETRLKRGDVLTYEDLQGYRSEIGRELRKGTLPGDVFYAYKGMQDDITNAMESIAKRNGMLEQFQSARDYYRQYAETFLDRSSPVRKAIDSPNPRARLKTLQGRLRVNGKDVDAVQALAQYDPELSKRLNVIRGYQSQADAVSSPKATPYKPPAELGPKPTPKKIGQTDVESAKRAGVEKASDWVRNRGVWAAAWPAIYIIRDLFHGNVPNIGTAGMEVAGTLAVSRAISKALENPTLVRFLSQATPADVEAIPPDLRGDFPKIVQAAAQRGAEISPTLRAMTTGGAALAPRKHPSDEWSQQPTQSSQPAPRNGDTSQFMVTPTLKGLVAPGNLPIWNRPTVQNADGSRSTEYSISMHDDRDGSEVLVPTVVGGKFLTPDGKKPPEGSPQEKAMFKRAWQHYQQTGENLGKFDNPADADAYADQLHNRKPRQ